MFVSAKRLLARSVRSALSSQGFELLRKGAAPSWEATAGLLKRYGVAPQTVLAKIDVQGAEMLVLKGMEGRLADLDTVIVETSTIATLHGGPEFRGVFQLLDRHGFVLWDIVRLGRRPLDFALAQLDAVFVPADSPLRADGPVEQAEARSRDVRHADRCHLAAPIRAGCGRPWRICWRTGTEGMRDCSVEAQTR